MNGKMILTVGLLTAALTAACSGGNKNGADANQANANPANANGQMPVTPTGINPTTTGTTPTGSDPTQGVTPAPNTHPASDNSDIETVMDKNGDVVETRTFKSNKYIVKVIKTTSAKDGKMIYTASAYDHSGKQHAIPGNKTETLMQMTGDDIARLAGIPVEKPAPGTTDTKETAPGANDKTKPGATKDELKKPKPSTP